MEWTPTTRKWGLWNYWWGLKKRLEQFERDASVWNFEGVVWLFNEEEKETAEED